MWLAHVTIGLAAISLLVAFAFGGGFGAHTTRTRAERAEQVARERIEQEARNRVERIEREAQKCIKDAEQQRDFAEQLVHDLLNETVDKKSKIAVLVAAKGVSNGATEIVDVARTGLREIYSRVNFWEKEPQEQ